MEFFELKQHTQYAGHQNIFKIDGRNWPMEQKMVGPFLKWWVLPYQTNHSWHLGSILYLHTDTDTYMHICILTADYTVKPVFSGHSKKKTNYRLTQVKSVAECSILQSFWPSLSYHFLLRSLFCLFLSGCLRQVLLYIVWHIQYSFTQHVHIQCSYLFNFLLQTSMSVNYPFAHKNVPTQMEGSHVDATLVTSLILIKLAVQVINWFQVAKSNNW